MRQRTEKEPRPYRGIVWTEGSKLSRVARNALTRPVGKKKLIFPRRDEPQDVFDGSPKLLQATTRMNFNQEIGRGLRGQQTLRSPKRRAFMPLDVDQNDIRNAMTRGKLINRDSGNFQLSNAAHLADLGIQNSGVQGQTSRPIADSRVEDRQPGHSVAVTISDAHARVVRMSLDRQHSPSRADNVSQLQRDNALMRAQVEHAGTGSESRTSQKRDLVADRPIMFIPFFGDSVGYPDRERDPSIGMMGESCRKARKFRSESS